MDIPENLGELSREQLDDLRTQATERATELRAAEPTTENVAELTQLADTLTSLVDRITEIDAQTASRADALARIEQAQQRAAEQPNQNEQPEPEQVTEPEPVTDTTPTAELDPEPEPAMSASAGTTATPRRVADIATTTTTPVPAATTPRRDWYRSLTAGAEISGVSAGAPFSSATEVGKAFQTRARALLQSRTPGRTVVANAHLNGLGDVVTKATGAVETNRRLLQAIDTYIAERDNPERRRDTVTAAGFCGPCDTITDFCEPEVADQLIDLPSIGIGRGCIEWYPAVDFREFDDYLGGEYCHDDLVEGVEKPCPEIPCPEPVEEQACVVTACATADIVSNWSMSEWTERYVRGILTRHQIRLSNATLARMEAGSEAVLYAAADFAGWGFTAALLSAIEVQAEDIRADSYLGMGDTIRVVMDRWVRSAIRADLVNRGGVDLLSVSNRRIDEMFQERGILVTWVKNWQADHIGQPGAQTKFPDTVKFLIYRDGSWVRGLEPVIELSNVYDAALLKQNKLTRFFTESAFLVVNMCGDSRVVEVPVCPSGVTAAPADAECLSEPAVAG